MAKYIVDSTTGNNADNGTTFDLAWATAEYALESGGLSAGDTVLLRPIHNEIPTSDISPSYSGTASSPIIIRGWSRAAIPNTTITQADFTNGKKYIRSIVGITPDRVKHTNRYITAPDGKQYHITAVLWECDITGDIGGVGEIITNSTQTKKGKVWAFEAETGNWMQYVRDSATAWVSSDSLSFSGGDSGTIDGAETAVGFLLSSEYAGSTVTGTNGKFQIDADPDYAEDQAIDDSTWTIKKTDWDAQDLPLIDFNDGAFQLQFYVDQYWTVKNIEFKDSADSAGIVFVKVGSNTILFERCLFKQTASNTLLFNTQQSKIFIKQVIIEGSGVGSSQKGISAASSFSIMEDVAIFNCGSYGENLQSMSTLEYNRLNMGIEMANGDDDIYTSYGAIGKGTGLSLGGANGYLSIASYNFNVDIASSNFQKILGNHVSYFLGGAMGATGGMANVDVGDSNAPSAASPAGSTVDLACFYPNVSGYEYVEDFSTSLVKWKIWAAASAETYTVYIQNNMSATLNDTAAKDDIFLKLTYIDSYDDTSEYTHKELFSTEIDILQRADATDWDSLTIANHTPAVAGWAILELFVSKYSATGQIYVDPKYV